MQSNSEQNEELAKRLAQRIQLDYDKRGDDQIDFEAYAKGFVDGVLSVCRKLNGKLVLTSFGTDAGGPEPSSYQVTADIKKV